jgi:hypothetical protein
MTDPDPATIPVTPLGDVYTTSAGRWHVVRRHGAVVMARHEALDLWEVFVGRVTVPNARFGSTVRRERPPLDADWGTDGWTCQGEAAAQARYDSMLRDRLHLP